MNTLGCQISFSNRVVNKIFCNHFHSTSSALARHPFSQNKIANKWGTYKRLAPSSLGKVDVRKMPHRPVPSHIMRPPYAETGVSSNWGPDIPILSEKEIIGMRQAGKLAKEILALGSTLCKVCHYKQIVLINPQHVF